MIFFFITSIEFAVKTRILLNLIAFKLCSSFFFLLLLTHFQYNINGIKDMFHPLSETCGWVPERNYSTWPNATTLTVRLPVMAHISPRPDFIPQGKHLHSK
jgi:hypothetical protein